MRFVVVGAGAMGTACSLLLARRREQEVTLWCHRSEAARMLAESRENREYLPGVPISPEITITDDPTVLSKADVLVLAVPTSPLRSLLLEIRTDWPPSAAVVSVIKGVERGTLATPTQIVEATTGSHRLAILSGPSHAEEIGRGLPASVVSASSDGELAEQVQRWFSNDRFRVYTTTDGRGVELAGALKNVIAIAAGICDGLALGDNAKAALVTRGLVEMVRLGVAEGAKQETFHGLAGLGDLLTTCHSRHSRNRNVGELIGKGMSLTSILASTRKVAEGVWTSKALVELAAARDVEMPVAMEVFRVLHEGKDPRRAVTDLMSRELRQES